MSFPTELRPTRAGEHVEELFEGAGIAAPFRGGFESDMELAEPRAEFRGNLNHANRTGPAWERAGNKAGRSSQRVAGFDNVARESE
jgi:hypothetical protein